jgi:DNA-binding transcriptional MerR regulator/methylmalonyl-CoA mutase cobalamin-binding subunit
MNKSVSILEQQAPGLYPIRTVSQLTGVNAITLRAWENRHGLVKPVRKESGHRLYTQEHIDLINRVVGMLDKGMRIGQVKPLLEAERAAQRAAEGDDEHSVTWRRYLDGMIAAVIRFDEEALEAVYNEALAAHPIRLVTERLVSPLLAELGERWSRGMGSIAEEHFFGFYLRNKLGARFHHQTRNPSGPRLLMACLPGERHEIGLLLCALAYNEAGYHPIILGSDMPLDELPPAARKTAADAIVLSGLLELSPALLRRHLPRLLAEAEVPVLMGGRASVMSFDALTRMGIEPLGADIDTGLRRLQQLVPPADTGGNPE